MHRNSEKAGEFYNWRNWNNNAHLFTEFLQDWRKKNPGLNIVYKIWGIFGLFCFVWLLYWNKNTQKFSYENRFF